MNFRKSSRRHEASLDMTPLIDVVFLLLIFFLVTTTFAKKKRENAEAISVNLPGGVAGHEISKEKSIVLTVTQDGHVRINDADVIQNDNIVGPLKQLYQQMPDANVLLRGDRGTTHGRIMDVLDKVKLAGFQKVNLVMKKLESPENGNSQ